MSDGGVTSDRIEQLVTASEQQTAASEELALAMVAHQERARLARRRFWITLALVVVGFVGLYIRQEINLHTSKDVRDRIVDCVDPAGQCYKDGQARTAKIVGDLNRVSGLAAACAPNFVSLPLPHRIVAIQRCIRRNLN